MFDEIDSLDEAKLQLKKFEILSRSANKELSHLKLENQKLRDYCKALEKNLEETTNAKLTQEQMHQAYQRFEYSLSNLRKMYGNFDRAHLCLKIEKLLQELSSNLELENFSETCEMFVMRLIKSISNEYDLGNYNKLIDLRWMITDKLHKIQESFDSNIEKLRYSETETVTLTYEVEKLREQVVKFRIDTNNNNRTNTQSQAAPVQINLIEDEFSVKDALIDYYTCPKCAMQMNANIGQQAYNDHVYKCGRGTLACVFCFRVFESKQRFAFNQHLKNEHGCCINEQN